MEETITITKKGLKEIMKRAYESGFYKGEWAGRATDGDPDCDVWLEDKDVNDWIDSELKTFKL